MNSLPTQPPGADRPARISGRSRARALGSCRAVVLSCIDYQYVTRLSEYLNRNRLAGAVDLVAWPGGAVALTNNDRDIVLGALHTAVTMHEPAEIVLTVHRDCAKLGGSGTFAGPLAESAVLEQTLGLAAAVAAAEFPALHISLVRLNDRHAAVEYAPTRPSVTRT